MIKQQQQQRVIRNKASLGRQPAPKIFPLVNEFVKGDIFWNPNIDLLGKLKKTKYQMKILFKFF